MALVKPFKSLPNIKRQPYNNEFVDYMGFGGVFSPEEIERIKAAWDGSKVIDAGVTYGGSGEQKHDLRKSEVIFLSPDQYGWIYDRLGQACIQANASRYKFDIRGFQTELQLARYTDGGFFDWHMDFGPGNISDRKLSMTVQLSSPEEYEGGDLQFMINQNVMSAPRTQGAAVIFPSFIQHRVQPVTKGERFSIVGWISGPPYR